MTKKIYNIGVFFDGTANHKDNDRVEFFINKNFNIDNFGKQNFD